MAQLVVYGRSTPCPDMHRWHLWLDQNEVEFVWFDIDSDREALRKVIEWTGHESVPTLVIADDDDGIDPAMAPRPLPRGRGPRGVDRGSMLTEPNPGQVEKFLQRNGIPFGPREADASGPSLLVTTVRVTVQVPFTGV